MRVWITKYALTSGIEQKEVDHSSYGDSTVRGMGGRGPIFYRRGEWHESLDSAQRKAEQMREKRIAALEKQLAKLRALAFDVQPQKETP